MRIAFYDIDGEVQVWLEHDVQFSGLCIGFGATRAAAAECAAEFLRKKIDAVFTAADYAGSNAPRTVDGRTRDPHSSAASSADPLPSIDSTQAHDPEVDRLVALIVTSLRLGGCSNCGGIPHTTTCRVGRLQRAFEASRPALAAADPALRTLSQHWRARANYLDSKEPTSRLGGRELDWARAGAVRECAADLDRVCPEIRDKPKSDPV